MNDPFSRDWTVNVNTQVNVSPKPKKPEPYADITVIIDESGSMDSMKYGVVEGFNDQVKKLRESNGDNRWSMVYFDDHASAKGACETFPKTVFENVKESEVPFLTIDIPTAGDKSKVAFRPRGGTALVDAVCLTMRQVSARTSGQDHIKPVMMIITDGHENSSREFTSEKMREMIARRQSQGWGFQFLATNQDAWTEAGKYGMANNTSYSASDIYSGSILSGCVASGSLCAYNFAGTNAGVSQGIGSGFTGVCDIASGLRAQHSYRAPEDKKLDFVQMTGN